MTWYEYRPNSQVTSFKHTDRPAAAAAIWRSNILPAPPVKQGQTGMNNRTHLILLVAIGGSFPGVTFIIRALPIGVESLFGSCLLFFLTLCQAWTNTGLLQHPASTTFV